jgi:hypothetical protein
MNEKPWPEKRKMPAGRKKMRRLLLDLREIIVW